MAEIVTLPEELGAGRHRRKLARYLREIADAIEADIAETEPHGFILVLTGQSQHEVLSGGYKHDWSGFQGAVWAIDSTCLTSYPTRGRNIRERKGGKYGAPYAAHNVVQFEAIRTKAARTAPTPDAPGGEP